MPKRKKKATGTDRLSDLLEMTVALHLYALGATQDQIAQTMGKQKLWVNELVRGLPRRKRGAE